MASIYFWAVVALIDATATITLLSSTSYDYTTVSDYIRLESSTPINWFKADMREDYGPRWDIAGIYSSGGNAAVPPC